jgi:hypothetical protein
MPNPEEVKALAEDPLPVAMEVSRSLEAMVASSLPAPNPKENKVKNPQ